MNAIGIDIGGTSIKGIVINDQGQILKQAKIATTAELGREHILSNMRSVIADLLASQNDVLGIGIGTAGRVNTETGDIVYATNNLPGWQGLNMKPLLESEYGRSVVIDNDANTALIGEAWLGAGKPYRDLTMLTLGTGVGGAIMVRGELIRGALWNGGEWGHVVLVPRGRLCNCGQYGCMEQYVSGTAFVAAAREVTQFPYKTGVEVLQDFIKGQPQLVGMVDRFLDDLVIVIYNIHLSLNPQVIIIGGGLVDSREYWWGLLTTKVKQLQLGIEVKSAELGNLAGAIGAAKRVFSSMEG
ncbi:ROK family protein [Paenibacillus sp. LMG 31460]|uniref:ROK family protein n=1 Tax=Paenibacillus germinis TaxID=2654979 RepID=A0ABX1YZ89_9BACL|nr:ROK family protein [Paenibacillus germinis]NOU86268.1 ROK family protein [Paenibacillus germinis]